MIFELGEWEIAAAIVVIPSATIFLMYVFGGAGAFKTASTARSAPTASPRNRMGPGQQGRSRSGAELSAISLSGSEGSGDDGAGWSDGGGGGGCDGGDGGGGGGCDGGGGGGD